MQPTLPCVKPCCKAGHELEKTEVVDRQMFCDMCQALGTSYGRCSKGCDYNLCKSCYQLHQVADPQGRQTYQGEYIPPMLLPMLPPLSVHAQDPESESSEGESSEGFVPTGVHEQDPDFVGGLDLATAELMFPTVPAEPPAPQKQHVLLSGRFVKEDRKAYMNAVKQALERRFAIRTFVVNAVAGESFGDMTAFGLANARVMVAFCTSTYGEKTGVGYETFEELKYAHEHQEECRLIALKLNPVYPPQPPDSKGRDLCKIAFSKSTVYINGLKKDPNDRWCFQDASWVAEMIKDSLQAQGLLMEVC